MTQKSVNVLSVVNSKSKISTQIINNKEHIVINDVVPIVDDIVMNGIFYPADEINKSYMTLNDNLMPLDHPRVNNENVSALNPQAINNFHIGAWGRNVRKSDNKVLMDAYIDRKFAESTEKGKLLVNRLDKMMSGEDTTPIHVSTGLIYVPDNKSGVSKGKKYTAIARNMQFDHVAILPDKQGAATPADGVGIFVNSQGDKLQVEQVSLIDALDYTKEGLINKVKFFISNNSDLSFYDIHDLIRSELNKSTGEKWLSIDAVYPSHFIYEKDRKQFKQKYLIDDNQTISFVGDAVEVKKTVVYDEIKTNGENQAMKEKILQALNAKGIKTDGLSDEQLLTAFNEQAAKDAIDKKKAEEEEEDKKQKATNSEEMPEWAKALNSKVDGLLSAVNANTEKELTVKREAVKAKFGMTDTAVNALSGEPLNELYAQCVTAAPINGGFANNSNQSICDMPE